jgi:hypothetical protein
MAQRDAALEAAFRNTDYCVLLPAGPQILRAGVADAGADDRLRQEAAVRQYWLILTPCNPLSVRKDEPWNNKQIIAMELTLKVNCNHMFHTIHRDQQGIWPDERGFFLPDFDLDIARQLGREHHQHALLYGRPGTAPELVWLTGR